MKKINKREREEGRTRLSRKRWGAAVATAGRERKKTEGEGEAVGEEREKRGEKI